jgi:tetratricopeptide (TPR) repeat protein
MSRVASGVCVVLLIGCAIGCDREADDRSPPVTLGTAAAPMAQEQEASDPDQGEELVPSTERLAEPTEEQEALLVQARTAFLRDQYEQAEAWFYELAHSEPVSGATVTATLALGQIYIETGRPEQALAFFDGLGEILDETPELLLVIARVYRDLGQPQQALQSYDRAFMARQEYLFILTEMAEILLELGEEDRAAQLLLHYEERLAQMAIALISPHQVPLYQRRFVVEIFAMLHDERAHDALTVALDDPEPEIRREAAHALGELVVLEAEPRLRRLAIEDRNEEVRVAARQAIDTLRRLRP